MERNDQIVGQPVGFSGWLILPLLFVITNPITSLYNTITLYKDHFSNSSEWLSLTNPASIDFDPLWRPALLFQLAMGVMLFILSLLLAYVFFGKKRNAPKVFIVILLVGAVSIVGNYIFAAKIHNISPETLHLRLLGLIRVGIFMTLAVPYMLKSKRIRNTFVN